MKKNSLNTYLENIELDDDMSKFKKIIKKLDNNTLRNLLLIFLQECEKRKIISEVKY